MMYTENTNLVEYVEQVEAENARLKGLMASIIIESHRDHCGDDAAAYSDIKEIIQNVEKKMSDKALEYRLVKRGWWIEIDPYHYKCSLCGAWQWIKFTPLDEYKFCYHCGANMDGDVE